MNDYSHRETHITLLTDSIQNRIVVVPCSRGSIFIVAKMIYADKSMLIAKTVMVLDDSQEETEIR